MDSRSNTSYSMESETGALVSKSTMDNSVDDLEENADDNMVTSRSTGSLRRFKNNRVCTCKRKRLLSDSAALETIKSEDDIHKKSISDFEERISGNSVQSCSNGQQDNKRHRSISEGYASVKDVTEHNSLDICDRPKIVGRQPSVCPSCTSTDTGICSSNGSAGTSNCSYHTTNKIEQDTRKFYHNSDTGIKHTASDVEFYRSNDKLINQFQALALDLKTMQKKSKYLKRSFRCVAFLIALLTLITTVVLVVLIVDSKYGKGSLKKDEVVDIFNGWLKDRENIAEACMSCDNVMYVTSGSSQIPYSVSGGLCCVQDVNTVIEPLVEKMRSILTSMENRDRDLEKKSQALALKGPSENIGRPDSFTVFKRSSLHLNGAYSRRNKGKFTWNNEVSSTNLVLVDDRERIQVGASANYFLYVKIRFKSTSNSTSSVGFVIYREKSNKSINKVVTEKNVVHFDGNSQEHDCRLERVLFFNEDDKISIKVKDDDLVAPASHEFGMFEI